MMTASTWADEIRLKRPNTAPWHFVDIPVQSNGYDPNRDCPRDDCVVAQIDRDARIVADRQLAPPVRAEALRFLIHFVGDIHQPLHAADNDDRGGNQVRVLLRQHHTNLHAVWDVDVVRALGRSPEEISVRLEREITPDEKRAWSAGTARDWANESFQIAKREVYGHISGKGGTDAETILPPDYARDERNFAAEQLEKAGVRLVSVLNQALR
jgi:nuclease S1